MKRILFFLVVLVCAILSKGQTYRYYKAQMHCHSTNSDGDMSPEQVKSEYKNRGYEILFLTDHNVMTNIEHLSEPSFLCINSEEVTFEKHINGFFLKHTINPQGITVQGAIDSIKSQGGLAQFNHPIITLTGQDWSYTAGEFLELNNLDFIEIHNWGTEFTFAPFNKLVWDSVISAGRAIWGTATDDMHSKQEVIIQTIDRGWVMVWLSELSRDSVYHALKNGRFYASTGVSVTNYKVSGDTIDVSCQNCNKIQFIGDNGSIRKTVNGTSGRYIRSTDSYIRVYMEGNSGLLGASKIYAWTQPHFYISPAQIAENFAKNQGFQLYPNPANDVINITYYATDYSRVNITMFDEYGREVMVIADKMLTKGHYNFSVSISGLTQGLYFVRVADKFGSKTKKFLKNN